MDCISKDKRIGISPLLSFNNLNQEERISESKRRKKRKFRGEENISRRKNTIISLMAQSPSIEY